MRRTVPVCLLLAAVTLAAYWPMFQNGFVNYDDPDYVTENPHVAAGLTPAGVNWAFQTASIGNWHPLTWLSHMADVQLFGLNPAGHHLVNLLLHTANAILLFLLLQGLTAALWRSAFVAAFFALHPLHVESVAWVAERKDVLSTLFFMLTLLAWAAKSKGQRLKAEVGLQSTVHGPQSTLPVSGFRFQVSGYYVLSLLCFALGLLAKPMLVTLPFVLLLLDYWPLGRLSLAPRPSPLAPLGRLLLEKVPFFVFSAASCVVTFLVQRQAGAVNSLEQLPFEFRIANALLSYVRYAAGMIWPGGLAVFYPAPSSWPIEWVLGSVLILGGITGLSLWFARRAPYLPVGWFWYLGTLVPVIGLIQVGNQAMADRYTYIPLIGLFVVAVWGACDWAARRSADTRVHSTGSGTEKNKSVCASDKAGTEEEKEKEDEDDSERDFGRWPKSLRREAGLAFAGVAVLAACGIVTWQQLAYWRTTAALFEHALAVTSGNYVAHNNLGVSLFKAGDRTAAEPHFVEAVRLRPKYSAALVNLGLCRQQQGRPEEAIDLFQRALRIEDLPTADYNLANLLAAQGKLEEAKPHYRSALKSKPEFPEAWYNLALLHARQGKEDQAMQEYAEALKLKPDYVEVRLTLGAALGAQGKLDEAIGQFNEVLRIAPDNADAEFNLAAALNAKGDPAGATAHYAAACRLRPNDADSQEALGMALLSQGKLPEAAAALGEVVRLRPGAQAHYRLAFALDAQGQAAEAAAHYREAIRLAPGNPVFLNDLAWLLATSPNDAVRDGPEAVRLAEQACQLSGGNEARFFGTLDAAYAEAGRFDDAIATGTKARALALAAGQADIAQQADQRLALYREHKPYRPPAAR